MAALHIYDPGTGIEDFDIIKAKSKDGDLIKHSLVQKMYVWYRGDTHIIDKVWTLTLDNYSAKTYLRLPQILPIDRKDDAGFSLPINHWVKFKRIISFYLPPATLEVVSWFTLNPGMIGSYDAEPGTLEEYTTESSARYSGLRHKVLVAKVVGTPTGEDRYRVLIVDRNMTQTGMLKLLNETTCFTVLRQWGERDDEYGHELHDQAFMRAKVPMEGLDNFDNCTVLAHRLTPIMGRF